ncbi:MAG: beta-galactosidase [Bacteroidales bacterium]|jgi:hypothetical protein|nr:beta-galactosidase [Bacteroidales bacterium]
MKKNAATIVIMLLACCINAQEQLKRSREIPIVAWLGVPEEVQSQERFEEMKDAGFNVGFSFYSNLFYAEEALDIAEKTGIKLIIHCPEVETNPREVVQRLKQHKAFFAYHLRDEPHINDFTYLGMLAEQIQLDDRTHPCYVNLFPNFADTMDLIGSATYREYLEAFIKNVPTDLLSFDHYPVRMDEKGNRTLSGRWYENLEEIASVSRAFNRPFWAFILASAHGDYPVPTVGEMKLQAYSNLAYGAQGLQYFTYWHPASGGKWNFHHSPINEDGKRSIIYDRIRAVNKELEQLSGVFGGAKMISVWHTGKDIPAGTRRLTRLPQHVLALQTDGNALVSLLQTDENRFMVIVNKDFRMPLQLTVITDHTVKKILKDGSLIPASLYASDMEIDAGDAAIYMMTED